MLIKTVKSNIRRGRAEVRALRARRVYLRLEEMRLI